MLWLKIPERGELKPMECQKYPTINKVDAMYDELISEMEGDQ
tara:strand:- start:1558 stop:1683 length:126 start_codon:yes stop_codon:yes gene_type:complete